MRNFLEMCAAAAFICLISLAGACFVLILGAAAFLAGFVATAVTLPVAMIRAWRRPPQKPHDPGVE